MKYKLLFSVVFLLFFLTGTAQTYSINKKADEVVMNTLFSASVREWFSYIEKRGIVLSYNSSIIDLGRKKEVKEKRLTVSDLLCKILNDYKIMIIPSGRDKLIIDITGYKERSISGIVKESESKEKLFGAIVAFTSPLSPVKYVSTDDKGFFSASLDPGNYTMTVSHIGYAPYKKIIKIVDNLFINVDMEPISFDLDEVKVRSRNTLHELEEISPSNMLSFNSSDVFANIQILPGVMNGSSGGMLNVNGGGNDENLYLLDGIPIHYPIHNFMKFSSFNGDAIKSVNFFNDFFPAEYEGKLSSVTDIKIKEGDKRRYRQTLSLDMPAASAFIEGPLIKDKIAYSLSGKRSWLDFFDSLLSDYYGLNHSFYNIIAKLSYDINSKNSLQVTGYMTRDNFDTKIDGNRRSMIDWENRMASVRFHTILGNRLINTNTIYYSDFNNRVYAPEIGYQINKYVNGGMREISYSSDFKYGISNVFDISMGTKISETNHSIVAAGDTAVGTNKSSIMQLSVYYDNKMRIFNRLYAQFGINFVAYLPRNFSKYYSVQPRFSFKFKINDENMLYLSISKMQQFYHYLGIDAMPLPIDFRLPSIMGFKPSTSEHYEIGWKLFLKQIRFESSAYFKSRNNILAFKPDVYVFDTEWNKYIMTGHGESYGVKFFMFGNWNKFLLQMSYSYSRSMEHFPELKDRGKVPSLSDIPHIGNFAATYKFTAKSSFSVGVFLHSGRIRDMGDDYESDFSYDKFRVFRDDFSYRVDAGYNFINKFKNGNKIVLRAGLYSILGNPSEEDVIEMYSTNYKKHCLPYFCISFKF